ncbi:MAG: pilus assembly protein [Alphaproteobacteria bacterium]|nr:pilus assembly protein [Alphaproteobacteria bacterium]
MWTWLNSLRKREKKLLFRASEGVTAIEFAIVAPVFFVVFLGIFEVGAIMLVQTSLETSILQISRFGRTGDTVAGQTPQQTALSLASNYSFGLVNPNQLVLTVTPYSSFSAMPSLAQAPTTGTQDFGGSKQAVLYTLSYNWQFFTPLVGTLLSPNGSLKLTASAVVQNEPF